MAYIDSANIKGTLYELQDTAARGSIAALETAVDARFDALETYVRDMSPVAYGNDEGIPVPIVTVRDAAPLNAEDVSFEIEPLQDGSGDPSPDNVRPITGWTGAEVTRCGKNLLPMLNISGSASGVVASSDDGVVTLDGTASAYGHVISNETFTLNAGTYYLKMFTVSGSGTCRYQLRSLDGATIYATTYAGIAAFTLEAQAIVKARVFFSAGTTFSNLKIRAMVVSGNVEPTDYEPYKGGIFDITFPSEAGTVYGGTVDLTKGKLVVDRGYIASYDGETLPGAWISSMDVYTPGGTPTTGAQVVYTLASAVEHNLTPQEIAMFKGTNNLWANTGDISVQYRQDVYTALINRFGALEALVLENMN